MKKIMLKNALLKLRSEDIVVNLIMRNKTGQCANAYNHARVAFKERITPFL